MVGKPLTDLGESDLLDRLTVKFPSPEWAFMPHVSDGTGGYKSRTADAIAMNLWPSRGLEIHGFEVKVYRSDWVRELRDPAKADAIAKYCDRWWLVVGDKGILEPGELPATWGLMIPFGRGLRAMVTPQKLTAAEPDRTFLAAILRRVAETKTPQAKIDAAYQQAREELKKEFEEAKNYRLKELQGRVNDFEKASGLKINNAWNAGEIGEAVKEVLARPNFKGKFEWIKEQAEHIISDCKDALAGLDLDEV